MTEERSPGWGIVGGGVLGLRLAERLLDAGHRVTLFESQDHVGGLASAWSLGDVVWDRHYHVTLLSDLHTRSLYRSLELEEDVRWVETRTGFYTDGRLYSLSNSLEFLRFPPLGLIDKFRLGLTILRASRIEDWQALERIPCVEWLERWSGRRTVEKIWVPLLRSKLGENYRHASAAFIWAIIARMYAARRSGLKKEMFGYVKGGYARVFERWAERLERKGLDLRLSARVRSIRRGPAGGLGVETDAGLETFGNVATTVAAPLASRLCPDLDASEIQRLQSIVYQGVVCPSVLLRRPLASYYVTNITDDWVPYTGVIEITTLVKPSELGGHHLAYLPKYVSSEDPLLQQDDETIRRRFLDALFRMYPHVGPEDVLEFKVSRVRYVLAVSTLGYSGLVPAFDTSVPGLRLVNSAQIVNGTLNVNETLALADRAADRFLEESKQLEAAA